MAHHKHLTLPRGAAALAPLARAGLRPPGSTVFGIVETAKRPSWEPYRTLHLDPRCAEGFSSEASVTIAVLTDDLIEQANRIDTHVFGCPCTPPDLEFGTWLDERAELAALLATLEYAEEEYDHDDPAHPAYVGVVRRVLLDFAQARSITGAADAPADPLVAEMTAQALVALEEVDENLTARVDVAYLANLIARAADTDPTTAAQSGTGGDDPLTRYLLRLEPLVFDGRPGAHCTREYSVLGVHGFLDHTGVDSVEVAVHAPASAHQLLSTVIVTHLGHAPAGGETAQDMLRFHDQVRELLPALRDECTLYADRVTVAVGILTGSGA